MENILPNIVVRCGLGYKININVGLVSPVRVTYGPRQRMLLCLLCSRALLSGCVCIYLDLFN